MEVIAERWFDEVKWKELRNEYTGGTSVSGVFRGIGVGFASFGNDEDSASGGRIV